MGFFEEFGRRIGLIKKEAANDAVRVMLEAIATRALEIAVDQIGLGELGENNRGKHVVRYKNGNDTGGAWCASFVSWCFEEAARQLGFELPFERSDGAKRLRKNVGRFGSFVKDPQPGDIICWHRGKNGSWQGHVGIVEKVKNGIVYTIEGNVGRYPAKVKRFKHDTEYERLVGYARITV